MNKKGKKTPKTRSREGRSKRLDLARHARKCAICRHPDREAIDEAFIHWVNPDKIEDDHNLRSPSGIYRHAHATGLYRLRRRNLRYALEHLIEKAERAVVSGDCVTRAVRAHSRVTSDGRWIDRPKHVIVSHRTVVETERDAGRPFTLNSPERMNGSFDSPLLAALLHPLDNQPLLAQDAGSAQLEKILIGTLKRLESAATSTNQTTDAISNRNKNTTSPERD